MQPTLLTAYMPPIQFFQILLEYRSGLIEVYDHYQKQTYRNRCIIYGANGVQNLTIPVSTGGGKCKTKDVKIDYSEDWQRNHWQSLNSAYGSSPFWEYYKDEFSPFFHEKHEFLAEMNTKLMALIVDILDLDLGLEQTTQYEMTPECDFRDYLSPKRRENHLEDHPQVHYSQVFSHAHGSQSNLSIIDLLCNCGPASEGVLRGLIRF